MRKLFIIFITCLSPLMSRAQFIDTASRTKPGEMAPVFNFSTGKGQETNLKNYRGKIVMINFFATWCGPCRLELPRVQKEIWNKYKSNPKFALFIFGREQGWDKILPFKEHYSYTFLMLPDEDRKIYNLYASQYIPRNVVIDEDGKIIYQSTGYEEKEFNKLLDLLASRLK